MESEDSWFGEFEKQSFDLVQAGEIASVCCPGCQKYRDQALMTKAWARFPEFAEYDLFIFL